MKRTGLRNNARSPSSITNMEHNDASAAKKVLTGTGVAFEKIFPTSTDKNAVGPAAVLRIANTTASVQFVFIGKESEMPAGTPDATTGLAVMPNSVEMFYGDVPEDSDEIVVKASDAGVQIAKLLP
jgi:hypothetical protein